MLEQRCIDLYAIWDIFYNVTFSIILFHKDESSKIRERSQVEEAW